ncbi:MAG TPA: methyltransferase domain-containing protein [Actinocrinis sp.]|nr:methyltransferase domain-containing protein [Actinocrinis sp.]
MESLFDGWDWHDPDGLEARFSSFTEKLTTFDTLEHVASAPPRDSAGLRAAGITGLEFAAFKTQHPEGLATDIASARARKHAASDLESGGLSADGVNDLGSGAARESSTGDPESGGLSADGAHDLSSGAARESGVGGMESGEVSKAGGDSEAEGSFVTQRGPMYRIDGGSLFTELDIAEPLPFDDGSMDWVYAEHLIEHVPLPVAVRWLKEVRRVLTPGGLLRVTTPDLAIYVEGYSGGGFFNRHRRRLSMVKLGPPMPARRAFMVNQIFYHFGHRWIYDEEELRFVLGEAGFEAENIAVRSFRTGARPDVADLDTSMRSDESIYIEAVA